MIAECSFCNMIKCQDEAARSSHRMIYSAKLVIQAVRLSDGATTRPIEVDEMARQIRFCPECGARMDGGENDDEK